jgi:hypothetical protein
MLLGKRVCTAPIGRFRLKAPGLPSAQREFAHNVG